MHTPYDIKLKHPADFKVKYRFYSEQEGGKKTLPKQGYRADFWYYHEEQPDPNSIYMIWPEFEDEFGNVITDSSISIAQEGTARMWIIMAGMRKFHRDKIKVGLKGYVMEGSRRVAECQVLELLALETNPADQ